MDSMTQTAVTRNYTIQLDAERRMQEDLDSIRGTWDEARAEHPAERLRRLSIDVRGIRVVRVQNRVDGALAGLVGDGGARRQ